VQHTKSPHYLSLLLLALLLACGYSCNNVNDAKTQQAESKIKTTDLNTEVIDLPERHYLVFRQRLPLDNMTGFFGIESKVLADAAKAAGIEPTGPLTGLFYEWNEEEGIGEAAIALPVKPGTVLGNYVPVTLPAMKAFAATLDGSYTGLGALYFGLAAQFQLQKVNAMTPTLEEYLVGPVDGVGESQFKTRVIHPIAP
jgi:hypothetical protein